MSRLPIAKYTWPIKLLLTLILSVPVVFLILGSLQLLVKMVAAQWPVWLGFQGKTAWDITELLIIPVTLMIIGYYISRTIKDNNLAIFQKQKDYENEMAEKRQEYDREIAGQRQAYERQAAQDEREAYALQNYFDQITELILRYDLAAAGSEAQTGVYTLVRARTLNILGSFKGTEAGLHKARVLQFLYESKLTNRENPVVILSKADLNGTELLGADLRGAVLMRASLRNVTLIGADLFEANLFEADLSEADLRGAILSEAGLSRATLVDANLSEANLSQTTLSEANLRGANLFGADLSLANLRGADLREAKNIHQANLSDILYDDATQWPRNFTPPVPAPNPK